jgi:hypothetical protein
MIGKIKKVAKMKVVAFRLEEFRSFMTDLDETFRENLDLGFRLKEGINEVSISFSNEKETSTLITGYKKYVTYEKA